MYKTILVPLDGSKFAESVLPYVEDLLDQHPSAKVIFLQVVIPSYTLPTFSLDYSCNYQGFGRQIQKAESYLDAIKNSFQKTGYQAETYITSGNPVVGILNAAKHRNVDLIVMASHHRNGIARILHPSISENVLHHTNKPIFLIRANGHNQKQSNESNPNNMQKNFMDLLIKNFREITR